MNTVHHKRRQPCSNGKKQTTRRKIREQMRGLTHMDAFKIIG